MMEPAPLVRAFIAIHLPADVRAGLEQLQRKLNAATGADVVRWAAVEQIHLTLKFLGDTAADRLDDLRTALERACAGVSPFRLEAGHLGCFPDLQKPRIVWVGIAGEVGRLSGLQREVESVTAGFGDHQEQRDFHPHLTLGRVRGRDLREIRSLGEKLQAEKVERLGEWVVRDVALIRSDLLPEGPRYTELANFPLSSNSAGA